LSSVALFDPTTNAWANLPSLSVARRLHTATMLSSGRVLVVGGYDATGVLASAELYDPQTGAWSNAGSMAASRYFHSATLLANGIVLVSGGAGSGALGSAELFNPFTNTWSQTGAWSAASGRYLHTAVLLQSGKVLAAGGLDGAVVNSAELYDPTTGLWTPVSNMLAARESHTATTLPSGKVLISSGHSASGRIASAELFDPAAGSWSSAGSLLTARTGHSAMLLPSGKVMIAGGLGVAGYSASTETYDPASNTWLVTSAMTTARGSHTATLLATGSMFVIGGRGPTSLVSVERFALETPLWTAGPTVQYPMYWSTATTLPSGKVLLAGAYDNFGISELFDPSNNTWSAAGSLVVRRIYHTATLLPDGRVMVVGGYPFTTTVELYDPATGTWSLAADMPRIRTLHTASLLPSGKVLVVGGAQNIGDQSPTAAADLYDPATNTWSTVASMTVPRNAHTATLLPDGKVLVAGGYNNPAYPIATELYDPVTDSWSTAGNLASPRYSPSAALLPNGRVLVIGGFNASGTVPSAEIYDPITNAWGLAASPATTWRGPAAVVLTTGKVLLAGQRGAPSNADAALYDPATNTWASVGGSGLASGARRATLLRDGRVLFSGGGGATADLYDPNQVIASNRRPIILAPPTHLSRGESLVLQGQRFRGDSEGSSGTVSNSASNQALVQLRRIDNGQVTWLAPSPTQGNDATYFGSENVPNLARGPHAITVFVNGIPSLSTIQTLGQRFAVTTTVSPPGSGSIECDPNPVQEMGVTVCTIAAAGSYRVGAVTGSCSGNITLDANNAFPLVVTQPCDVLASFIATLDVDASGAAARYNALTDGLLVLRYMQGVRGPELVAGAISSTGTRTDPVDIAAYLSGIALLDVDDNGSIDANTDGLLVIRYMLGLRGDVLLADALGANPGRFTVQAIESTLRALMP
jgi:N-acetylneuraminic acid mutarotase